MCQYQPYVVRYWDEKRQYVNDGENTYGDVFYTKDRFVYFLSKRAAYQASYDAAHVILDIIIIQPELPSIYATLTFSGGDGKLPMIGVKLGHISKGILMINGDLRATPAVAGLPKSITFEWRITLRKIVSEFTTTPIDSFPVDGCTVMNNIISMAFGLSSDYTVKLVGGPKCFKVLR